MRVFIVFVVGLIGSSFIHASAESSAVSDDAEDSWLSSFSCIESTGDRVSNTESSAGYLYQSLGNLVLHNLEDYQGAIEVEKKSIGWLKSLTSKGLVPPIQINTFAALRREDYWVEGYAVLVSSRSGTAWMVWDGNHEIGLTPRASFVVNEPKVSLQPSCATID